jgi:hypothetical protein
MATKLMYQKEIAFNNIINLYNMKTISLTLSVAICLLCVSCDSKKNPEHRTYESSYNSNSTATDNSSDDSYVNSTLSTGSNPYNDDSNKNDVENDPYISNSLRTGSLAYSNESSYTGSDSKISVSTSSDSNCDVVVILKSEGEIVRNAYIKAGGSYSFSLPNGSYQVFFYGGRGWNPNKDMANGQIGGFVANESYSKDSPVSLYNQELTYELIPQANGNFSTQQSSSSEIF